MPSRSNPNTPTASKRKTARTIKSKRQQTQRLAANKITKPTPHTSQAIRKAAPLSRKKARKVEKKIGYARKRATDEAGEVEMKDVAEFDDGKSRQSDKVARERKGQGDVEMDMEVDGVE